MANSVRGNRSQEQLHQAATAGETSRSGRRSNYCTDSPGGYSPGRVDTAVDTGEWAVFDVLILSVGGPAEAGVHQFRGRGADTGNGHGAFLALKSKYTSTSRATMMDLNEELPATYCARHPQARPRRISSTCIARYVYDLEMVVRRYIKPKARHYCADRRHGQLRPGT